MKTKKLLCLLLTVLLICTLLGGCSTTLANANDAGTDNGATQPANDAAQPETNEDTAQPTQAILVVSFGTSYNDSRDITIGAIENAIAEAYPDYSVRRAFTAQTIIDILKDREGLDIDNVSQAMDRLVADGVKTLIVQPTHLMSGYEYDDLVAELGNYTDKFDSITVGAPLLSSKEDRAAVIAVITAETASYSDDHTAVIFMGHGTEHPANAVYATMQDEITAAGYSNYFIGTVEATPSLDDMIAAAQAGGYTKVVLEPLMVVAGDHANNDMAGDEEGSWKTAFEAAGFEVECLIRGLGQFEGIQQIYVQHVQKAIDGEGCVIGETAGASVPEGPIQASQIKDGTYDITVTSSSSMFNIVAASLTVKDGAMHAIITLSGDGYQKLYMGTGEAAQADTDDHCIYFVTDAEGKYTYDVPVEALDQETDVAAWSTKKEQWYDRTLVFESSKIPADAFTGN